LGFEKEGDIGVGIVIFVQIELGGEKGGIALWVKELAKYALGTTGDEDTEGKGWIGCRCLKNLEDLQLVLVVCSCGRHGP
jgi:hypothetical protein